MDHLVYFRQHIWTEAQLQHPRVNKIETLTRWAGAPSRPLEEDDAVVHHSDWSRGGHAGRRRRARRAASRAFRIAAVNSSSEAPAPSTARAMGSAASASDSGATSSLAISC